MKQKLEIIKNALTERLNNYCTQLIAAIKEGWHFQNFGKPGTATDWALMNDEGKCVTAQGIAHLVLLIINLKSKDEAPNGLPLDPWQCIMALDATSLYGDRSDVQAYNDTITMLADAARMGMDAITDGGVKFKPTEVDSF